MELGCSEVVLDSSEVSLDLSGLSMTDELDSKIEEESSTDEDSLEEDVPQEARIPAVNMRREMFFIYQHYRYFLTR